MNKTTSCKISIVVPVYREADRIDMLVDNLRAEDRQGRCEIIVVDGEPDGSTLAAVTDPDVVKVVSAKGRARQMNAGAAPARGDVLLFLHADTRLPRGGLDRIAELMVDERYVGGAFGLAFDSGRQSHNLLALVATARSRLTKIPLGDHAIFLRRAYFAEIGGYANIPLMEDVELMRRVKKRGGRIRILKERVRTSSRRLEEEGLVYYAIRACALLILYSLGFPATRLKHYYPDGHR